MTLYLELASDTTKVFRLLQPANAPLLISAAALPRSTVERPVQSLNASKPMRTTLSGTVTLVSPAQPLNASYSKPITGMASCPN